MRDNVLGIEISETEISKLKGEIYTLKNELQHAYVIIRKLDEHIDNLLRGGKSE